MTLLLSLWGWLVLFPLVGLGICHCQKFVLSVSLQVFSYAYRLCFVEVWDLQLNAVC